MIKPGIATQIIGRLEACYPEARTSLRFSSPFELLVATILSAQSTDKQVNRVTRKLFKDYASAKALAGLAPEELEKYINGCGLFRTKSKNIIATSKMLVEQHQGRVPDNLEELMKLPGVGRKTANVVLSNAFGRDAIAVDTHVFRVANRLGLAHSPDPLGTEKDLQSVVPKKKWSQAHHWLISHGRNVCKAKNPNCSECCVSDLCHFFSAQTRN